MLVKVTLPSPSVSCTPRRRLIVKGTTVAPPDAVPKLVELSMGTMPLSVSTFTPFDPSAGYGPPVSSGIISRPRLLKRDSPRS